jgi:hypothetical protein
MDVDLPRVARTFLRFVRGAQASPPSDAPVGLYLGGELVRTIDPPDLGDRDLWEGLCPEAGAYAGRVCPFSVLDPLRTAGEELRIVPGEAATHPCAHPQRITADVGGSHVVTLVPDPDRSCVDWVAVELFVNDLSQVVAVDLVWAEP